MLKYPCDEGIQHLCYWLLFFFFCCRPWNWYFSGTTWSSESKADIFCREWQWFQTFSRGISLVYNKHPLLNVFLSKWRSSQYILIIIYSVFAKCVSSAETVYWSKTSFEFCCISESHWTSFWAEFELSTIQLLWCQLWEFGNGSTYNPQIDIFSILITILLDIVSILLGEILLWFFYES